MEGVGTAGRMEGPHAAHRVSVSAPHHAVNYFAIFVLLVVLTVVTVALALKRFNNELVNVMLALTVASVKAIFVARYFMHLKFEGKLIYLILAVPLGFAIVLTIALIPDIGFGRHTDFNDSIGWFEHLFGR